ncbi:EamA family transporter [Nakamurella antarctica]|uniref:EamA family transporter n=1 Tax=Nakamurella antarctica TaxID=1902245 RepID=A0A3G8ZUP4_9ACTN|nr:DMT family transporter [Nakamurella antarctica]AZI58214.1 EamA family transporter [Nakamurella antarctica]
MSGQVLVLILIAALCHALWNFAAKRVSENPVLFVWLTVAGAAVLWVPIAVAWSWGEHLQPDLTWVLAGLLTSCFHTLYSLTLQHGYAVGDLNVVYPLARGTGPIVTMVVAIVFLGERLSSFSIAGAAIIIIGILVVATGRRASSAKSAKLGVIWGVMTGLTIATYTLWDDHVVNDLGIAPLPYFALGLVLESMMLAPGAWRSRAAARAMVRSYWREITVVAVLSPLAYILVLEAMKLAPVAIVAPARETSIVVGSLLAWLVLKEPRPARRLLGSAIVLAGISMLVLA